MSKPIVSSQTIHNEYKVAVGFALTFAALAILGGALGVLGQTGHLHFHAESIDGLLAEGVVAAAAAIGFGILAHNKNSCRLEEEEDEILRQNILHYDSRTEDFGDEQGDPVMPD